MQNCGTFIGCLWIKSREINRETATCTTEIFCTINPAAVSDKGVENTFVDKGLSLFRNLLNYQRTYCSRVVACLYNSSYVINCSLMRTERDLYECRWKKFLPCGKLNKRC